MTGARSPAPGSGSSAALVHDWLTGMRGGEKVLEAIGEMFPEAPIYTLFHLPGSVSPALESHPIRTSFLQRAPGLERHYRRYLPLFPAAVEDLDLTGHGLVISTSHCVAKGVIPPPGSRHLCYCHTPMRYAWDQERVYFPRRRGVVARLRNLVLSSLRRWDVTSAARVDRFVANSRFVAERIRRYYRRRAEVVHPPIDTDRLTPGDGEPGEYCLVVAALSPYKRLGLAIAACERAGIELRIVGDGPERRRLERLAGDRTRFLGRVDDDRLRALLRGAACLLQPGLEDFGMTPVEALACGTPVVALGAGGVLDIVEDGRHGVLYEPTDDPERIAAAIDKCRHFGFNKMDLRRRSERFSIDRFRERLQTVLASLPSPEDSHP